MDKRKRRLLCMLEGSGRKSRWISGAPPLSFKALAAGTLENYRIYGNTVGGESVGDKTGNLWDGTVESGCYIDKNTHQIVSGSGASDTSNFIVVEPNTIYTFSFNKNTPYSFNARVIAFYTQMKEWLDYTEYYVRIDSSVNITIPNNCYYIRITIDKAFSGIMLNAGSTALPYEPYGYKVPVTVSNGTDALTTPIYLPEQIRKVGDEVEYIDYAEQKQHRIGADDVDVTLPALPTLPGTNVLSVGTAVQPSEIEVKGKIKAL